MGACTSCNNGHRARPGLQRQRSDTITRAPVNGIPVLPRKLDSGVNAYNAGGYTDALGAVFSVLNPHHGAKTPSPLHAPAGLDQLMMKRRSAVLCRPDIDFDAGSDSEMESSLRRTDTEGSLSLERTKDDHHREGQPPVHQAFVAIYSYQTELPFQLSVTEGDMLFSAPSTNLKWPGWQRVRKIVYKPAEEGCEPEEDRAASQEVGMVPSSYLHLVAEEEYHNVVSPSCQAKSKGVEAGELAKGTEVVVLEVRDTWAHIAHKGRLLWVLKADLARVPKRHARSRSEPPVLRSLSIPRGDDTADLVADYLPSGAAALVTQYLDHKPNPAVEAIVESTSLPATAASLVDQYLDGARRRLTTLTGKPKAFLSENQDQESARRLCEAAKLPKAAAELLAQFLGQ